MSRNWSLAVMTAVLLMAAVLRFYQLDHQSFWNDEGNSARLSERSIPLIIEGTASDIHPPFYYLLLKTWRTGTGSSEFGLRSLSAYLGIGLVALSYSLGRKVLPKEKSWVSIAAAVLVAINPALIYYSQEARMYELMAFLATASCLILIRLLNSSRNWAAVGALYVIAMAAGFYTHYFFPAVLFVQFTIVAAWLWGGSETKAVRRRRIVLVLEGLALAVLIYSPWLPIFVRQAGGRAAQRAVGSFLLEIIGWLGFGGFQSPNQESIGLVVSLVLVFSGLTYLVRRKYWREPYGLAVPVGAAVPLAAMVILGTTNTPFYKFTLMASPWLALLTSLGFAAIWSIREAASLKVAAASVTVIMAAALLWTSGRALINMFFDQEYARADYRGIAEEIKREDHPSAGIILNAANQWEVFTYYYDEREATASTILPIPRGGQKPEAVYEELEELAEGNSRIYALFWGEAEQDPQRLVERWLDDNGFKARDEWVGDVRFVVYSVGSPLRPGAAEELNLSFGDVIVLQSASVGSTGLFPGEILPITFQWTAESTMDKRYKVFLHLLNQDDQIVAQRDSEPGGGLDITSSWSPGEVIQDNHGLYIPEDVPPGEYRLLMGLYDIADPLDRLLIQSADGESDAYYLGSITIKANPE